MFGCNSFYLFRYASLYFCCAVEDQDNELITLEIIHRYVELLDKYFGSVSPINVPFGRAPNSTLDCVYVKKY